MTLEIKTELICPICKKGGYLVENKESKGEFCCQKCQSGWEKQILKKWVSVESLKEHLNYDLKIIMSNADKKKKEFISTYIKLLMKELERVKE